MPGMAANPSIFEHIKLPEQQYTIHLLDWMVPDPKESLAAYARRMTLRIKHDNITLIGVSFGGLLVQEMAAFIKIHRLIIVSSVKSKKELPRRITLSRKLKLYKIIPTRFIEDVDTIAKYAFGTSIKNRVALYQKYLSMNDRHYLRWALREMVCWDQLTPPDNIIHIHGSADKVFPIKYIGDCLPIEGGTHIMILNRAKWFNENLPKLIENKYIDIKQRFI